MSIILYVIIGAVVFSYKAKADSEDSFLEALFSWLIWPLFLGGIIFDLTHPTEKNKLEEVVDAIIDPKQNPTETKKPTA